MLGSEGAAQVGASGIWKVETTFGDEESRAAAASVRAGEARVGAGVFEPRDWWTRGGQRVALGRLGRFSDEVHSWRFSIC